MLSNVARSPQVNRSFVLGQCCEFTHANSLLRLSSAPIRVRSTLALPLCCKSLLPRDRKQPPTRWPPRRSSRSRAAIAKLPIPQRREFSAGRRRCASQRDKTDAADHPARTPWAIAERWWEGADRKAPPAPLELCRTRRQSIRTR